MVALAPSTVGCCLPHQPSAKTCLWSNLIKAIPRFPFTPGCFQVVDSQNCSLAVSARFAPFLQESISNQILSIVRHCHPASPRSVQPSPLILCLVSTLWKSAPHLSFIKAVLVPFCWLQSLLLWSGPLLIPLRASLMVKSLALTVKESQVSGIGTDWCFTRIFPRGHATNSYWKMLLS